MGRCGVLLMMFRIKSLLLFAIVLTLGAVYFSWEILSVPDEPKLDDILRAHKKFSTITIRRKGGYHGHVRALSSSPPKQCKDSLCMEFLDDTERKTFEECQQKASRKLRKVMVRQVTTTEEDVPRILVRNSSGVMTSGRCRFMNGTGRGPVGLVSFAGSGNTWVRGLLQQATGICTGAAYCDSMLRFGGFDGEGLQTTSTIVVKSHSVRPTWSKVLNIIEFGGPKNRLHFDAVIFIIRNPFHALVSEFNRQLNSKNKTRGEEYNNGQAHIAVYGPEYFGEYQVWNHFIDSHLKRWTGQFDWLIERPVYHQLLVVRYEDLKKDVSTEVRRMLRFLHFEIDDAELSERLKSKVGMFHRKSAGIEFDHFTHEQRMLINDAITEISEDLNNKFRRTYGIDEYIYH